MSQSFSGSLKEARAYIDAELYKNRMVPAADLPEFVGVSLLGLADCFEPMVQKAVSAIPSKDDPELMRRIYNGALNNIQAAGEDKFPTTVTHTNGPGERKHDLYIATDNGLILTRASQSSAYSAARLEFVQYKAAIVESKVSKDPVVADILTPDKEISYNGQRAASDDEAPGFWVKACNQPELSKSSLGSRFAYYDPQSPPEDLRLPHVIFLQESKMVLSAIAMVAQ